MNTAARKHKAERHARGFSSWGQVVAMLFGQLGMLVYANEHRPWQLYEDVCRQLLTQCQALAVQQSGSKREFRFKRKLITMYATVIDLCSTIFD